MTLQTLPPLLGAFEICRKQHSNGNIEVYSQLTTIFDTNKMGFSFMFVHRDSKFYCQSVQTYTNNQASGYLCEFDMDGKATRTFLTNRGCIYRLYENTNASPFTHAPKTLEEAERFVVFGMRRLTDTDNFWIQSEQGGRSLRTMYNLILCAFIILLLFLTIVNYSM